MADMYVQGPRRVAIKFELRPGEMCQAILQEDVLESFTDEELNKMNTAIRIELQSRGDK